MSAEQVDQRSGFAESVILCRQNTSSHAHFSQILLVSPAHCTYFVSPWLSCTLHCRSVPRHLRCLRTHDWNQEFIEPRLLGWETSLINWSTPLNPHFANYRNNCNELRHDIKPLTGEGVEVIYGAEQEPGQREQCRRISCPV